MRLLRRINRGQSLVETVIVIAAIPVIAIMINAVVYFGNASSTKLRLNNYARYAAIKVARGEPVDDYATVFPPARSGGNASFSSQPVGWTDGVAAVAVNSAFVNGFNADFHTDYSGESMLGAILPMTLLTQSGSAMEVTAQAYLPNPSNMPFVGARLLRARAGFDAKTWRTGADAPNDNPIGDQLLPLMRSAFFNAEGSIDYRNRGFTSWADGGVANNKDEASIIGFGTEQFNGNLLILNSYLIPPPFNGLGLQVVQDGYSYFPRIGAP